MILLCGQEVGVKALRFFRPRFTVCYDEKTKTAAKELKIPQYSKLTLDNLTEKEDVLLSVHGREIVREPWLSKKAFNIHPYLYCYRGADPIGKAIEAENTHASVGLHRMTEKVDSGEVLFQAYCDVKNMGTHDEVYRQLYPLYYACFEAFKRIL